MWRNVYRSNRVVVVSLPVSSRCDQPVSMQIANVSRHVTRRNNKVLKLLRRPRKRDASKDPEEVWPEVSLSLCANAAAPSSGNKGFDLNVSESSASSVAAKDICVWGVAKRYHSGVATATQLAGDVELA